MKPMTAGREPAPTLRWPTVLPTELADRLVEYLNLTSPGSGYQVVVRGRGAKITVGGFGEEIAALERRRERIQAEIAELDAELQRLR